MVKSGIATHILCDMMRLGHGQSFRVIGQFFHGVPLIFLIKFFTLVDIETPSDAIVTENEVGFMKKGPMAAKLSGGHIVIKVPDVGCAIHDLT